MTPSSDAEPAERRDQAAEARSQNTVNAIIHMYRAEIGRLTSYRARLDTTTNWAISSSALGATLAFGSGNLDHPALIFLMFLNYFFLHLEARRFRHYETSRYRAQVLERLLVPEIEGEPLRGAQARALAAALRAPPPPVSRWGAIGWRLRRTYLWIYSALLLAWLSKLDIGGSPTLDPLEIVRRAAIGSLPGWLVVGTVAVSYLWLLLLAVLARRNYPLGDDEVRELVSNAPD